jgi:ketosteroid isomerase-like protein
MFERFTEPARRTLFFSRAEATAHGRMAIGPEHLLLGLLREKGGAVGEVLSDARLSPQRLREVIESAPAVAQAVDAAGDIPFSQPTKHVLQYAAEEADLFGHSDIAPEHLLLGLLRESSSLAASALSQQGLELGVARNTVVRLRQKALESNVGDVALLHAMRERLEAAENAFDPGPIAEVMADDVVLMVPNEPVQSGKAEAAAFIARILEEQQAWFDRHVTYVSDEVSVRGDTAFDRGTFSFTVIAKHDGRTTEATGKYLWVYARAASKEWMLWRLIASLDGPLEDE